MAKILVTGTGNLDAYVKELNDSGVGEFLLWEYEGDSCLPFIDSRVYGIVVIYANDDKEKIMDSMNCIIKKYGLCDRKPWVLAVACYEWDYKNWFDGCCDVFRTFVFGVEMEYITREILRNFPVISRL